MIRGSPCAHAADPRTATNRIRPNSPIARSAMTDATARDFRSGCACAMKYAFTRSPPTEPGMNVL